MREGDESAIVLAHHYSREGVDYAPGDTLTLPTPDARQLVANGYAKAYVTPLIGNDEPGEVQVRSDQPARLTTTTGVSYTWHEAGAVIPVREEDGAYVLGQPGFTLMDDGEPVEEPVDTVSPEPFTDDE